MTQLKKILMVGILVGFFAISPILSVAASTANDPIDTAPALSFFTQYTESGIITRSIITAYDKKRDSQGDYSVESKIPADIKKALFSPTTQNPFKKAYATFYTSISFKQLQKCHFTGADFNLDNNPKTEEWYISTSATGCIEDQSYIDGGTSHNWIIQRNEASKFKVLMESDRTLRVNPITTQSTYRPLGTYHNIQRFMPKSTLGCGDVYLEWRYNNTKKQYQYVLKNISIGSPCNGDLAFETTSDPSYKKAVAAIEKIVNPWVKNNLPAFR
ncbi:hypothetical protein [Thiofilum flexile]|uniref:hypothetical protein n=1 Tax=Thiofilum flexile TaxID=125627 RepID=UPI000366487F|nr:hypothetical protein [Thiofilum flexile]